MLPQEMVMTLKKFPHLNIRTLRKYITLKYLTKIYCYPYFHINTYFLNKSFDDL